jgi:hypothetical protein
MFEALSDRFEGIFKRLRNSGRLTEAEVDEVLREIRVALLEADVNVRVVRSLQARIRERCVGVEVGQALTSAQFVIKVVNEELTDHPRRRDDLDHLRVQAPDRGVDGGPAGVRQDHHVGQARSLVQGTGPPAAARRSRPAAPGSGRAAPHPRGSHRRSGLQRAERPRERRCRARSPRRGVLGATWSSSTRRAAWPSMRR